MSVENLTSLVENELGQVNERILEACKNHVELIPEVAEPPPTPGLRREGSRGDEKGNS